MKQNNIAVSLTAPKRLQEAKNLAKRLQLELIMDPKTATKTYDYLLLLTRDYLGLQKVADKKCVPFYLDFSSRKMLHRLKRATLRNELVARAIGFHPRTHPVIVDATAGLGRDSLILASLGFKVILLERSPIIHALLQDALNRCSLPYIHHLHLIYANAIDWLKKLSHDGGPDVIYIDPMFLERNKSASVKKEMVVLQNLIGKDEDAKELFYMALACAKYRVVVKRHRLAANIVERAPNFSLNGKINRFDIYIT
ncbi:MAG: hypothetical protein A3F42_02075 [Gammaproteobacteria bacterium RIFCSPHIGHO2_12_FULL_37_34]|nr:MAG: hypothetical protein A3F42_02075 [Gammaproteobacteria bacterium RIFCSPHIGHO2_12_FULL_37_34]